DLVLYHDRAGLVLVPLELAVVAGQLGLPQDVLASLAAPFQGQLLVVGDALSRGAAPRGPVAGRGEAGADEEDGDGGESFHFSHVPVSGGPRCCRCSFSGLAQQAASPQDRPRAPSRRRPDRSAGTTTSERPAVDDSRDACLRSISLSPCARPAR